MMFLSAYMIDAHSSCVFCRLEYDQFHPSRHSITFSALNVSTWKYHIRQASCQQSEARSETPSWCTILFATSGLVTDGIVQDSLLSDFRFLCYVKLLEVRCTCVSSCQILLLLLLLFPLCLFLFALLFWCITHCCGCGWFCWYFTYTIIEAGSQEKPDTEVAAVLFGLFCIWKERFKEPTFTLHWHCSCPFRGRAIPKIKWETFLRNQWRNATSDWYLCCKCGRWDLQQSCANDFFLHVISWFDVV